MSETLDMFADQNLEKENRKCGLLPSDFHVRICQLLESEKVSEASEVLCSLKQFALSTNCDPIILSLKTSKAFFQAMTDETLKSLCKRLPTSGIMHNGNCLILSRYYPKIESGCSLSDILEKLVDEKYFLSEKMIKCLTKPSGGVEVQAANCLTSRQHKMGRDDTYIISNSGQGRRREVRTTAIPPLRSHAGCSHDNHLKQVGVIGKESEATRVYSTDGVARTIKNGGGQGAKTDLYEIIQRPHEYNKGGTKKLPSLRASSMVHNDFVCPVLTPDLLIKRQNGRRMKEDGEPMFTLTGQDKHGVFSKNRIRRLTEIECERLQGFEDNFTKYGNFNGEVKEVSGAQKYKMLGNAVTVPIVKLIGSLILKNELSVCNT